jgi:hypothetical protein
VSGAAPAQNRQVEGIPLRVAFYLPQFHRTPQNDAWHGSGFTEWSVVAASRPLFPGHAQPHLPGELGFYDLRLPETRELQARLARSHGISGFCYYHYWFKGRRMLERPFNEVLRSGQPDFPFCLCWANESWYRRWQGSADELVMEQEFDEEDDVEHIRWMIEAFRDERYIRIKGRPLLTIYRPQDLPDPKRTVEIWRDECSRAGLPDPWLVGFETRGSVVDPADIGFDAGAQFVPHGVNDIVETTRRPPSCDPSNTVYDYADVAAAYVGAADPPWIRYPCVATGWDNTPRRRNGEALLLLGSTPDRYGAWLERAIRSQMRSEGGDGIVFVNAWNEWAEGAHLEPDADNGRAYLEVTRRVVEELGGSVPLPSSNEAVDDSAPTSIEDLYTDLYESFVLLQNRSSGYLAIANRRLESWRDFYNQELEKLREQNRTLASWCLSLDEQVEFLSGQRQTGEPP